MKKNYARFVLAGLFAFIPVLGWAGTEAYSGQYAYRAKLAEMGKARLFSEVVFRGAAALDACYPMTTITLGARIVTGLLTREDACARAKAMHQDAIFYLDHLGKSQLGMKNAKAKVDGAKLADQMNSKVNRSPAIDPSDAAWQNAMPTQDPAEMSHALGLP